MYNFAFNKRLKENPEMFGEYDFLNVPTDLSDEELALESKAYRDRVAAFKKEKADRANKA